MPAAITGHHWPCCSLPPASASVTARALQLQVCCTLLQCAERFGWEVATSIKLLGQQAEREAPTLQPHTAWGDRTDTGAEPAAVGGWGRLLACSLVQHCSGCHALSGLPLLPPPH